MPTGFSFKNTFPIVSRSFHLHEWILIASATRMMTGLVRIVVNRPSRERPNPMTNDQRWKSFLERVFIEGIGVPVHVFTVYGFQEPISKLFEKMSWLKPPSFKADDFTGLDKTHAKGFETALNQAVEDAYCVKGKTTHIVADQIYNRSGMVHKVAEIREKALATFNTTHGQTLSHLPEGVAKVIDHTLVNAYQRKLWLAGAATLTGGVLASAFITGYVMQKFNDNVLSKHFVPWIMRTTGITPPAPKIDTPPVLPDFSPLNPTPGHPTIAAAPFAPPNRPFYYSTPYTAPAYYPYPSSFNGGLGV